jgi:hypothetical protein
MAHVIECNKNSFISLGLADWILKIQFSDKNSFYFILLKYHFPSSYLF